MFNYIYTSNNFTYCRKLNLYKLNNEAEDFQVTMNFKNPFHNNYAILYKQYSMI